ncbi:endonuclease/exonuclease/phosphatase family [Reticulomyxa filosa]|uniref:Endonuclease/exonuclease/phosphatase family n=1 Tax=Reticulomyxa filosa TaxID=46433 RepID=X6P4R9_RETFI|nr:endonuclease/exonuclease/phosphatase family [Reticulomyxa filosa]|eukprot:ETO33535.1 endonuclease/exonuclease/phosphatase family [Reticulomyxa filosa]
MMKHEIQINIQISMQKWNVSGITYNDLGAYGNVIFSRIPLTKVHHLAFEKTKMGRKLVCAEFTLGDSSESFYVGNVHLESLNPNLKYRIEQLKEVWSFFNDTIRDEKKRQHFFLMGDFNQCGTHPYLKTSKSSTKTIDPLPIDKKLWSDSWLVAYQNDLNTNPGYTMPESNFFNAWRPDRILYQFDTKAQLHMDAANNLEWKLQSIERIGMEEMPLTEEEIQAQLSNSDMKVLTPSDHYGVFTTFVLGNEDMVSQDISQNKKSQKTSFGEEEKKPQDASQNKESHAVPFEAEEKKQE